MTYMKPEINTLGAAQRVIQFFGKPLGNEIDGDLMNLDPAYDLDE